MYSINNSRPILKIDLEALKRNYIVAKNHLNVKTNCAAVIKANAYGVGAREVFKTLKSIGCRDFYFAYIDEALELEDIITSDENVFIVAPQTANELKISIEKKYTSVLSSLKEIKLFKEVSSKIYPKAPCVLHFDTGMNRLGIDVNEINHIDYTNLNIVYVMSHLACADNPTHPLNEIQLKLMQKISLNFPNIKVSFCNSSGIFLGSDYHFDQARIGAMLYGINPTPSHQNVVSNVISIYAKVVGFRTLDKISSISYGASIERHPKTKIATLAIGYADGHLRSSSNVGFGFACNHKLPILGRVTMDFIMIDVSALTDSELESLEYVEVMGANVTVDQLAESAGTIGYEILTSLKHRYNRHYV